MCLYPTLIKNRKYIANKKNGGNIPAVSDSRVLIVPVGCGKCMECRKKKTREWQVRLTEDVKNNTNGKYITFTLNNDSYLKLASEIKNLEGYELDNEIMTLAIRRFLERWRKKYKKSVRHWLVTELGKGKFEHIHIHGLIYTDIPKEEIDRIWSYGYTEIRDKTNGGYVNERTINYIVKYINKTDEMHKEYTPKILCSKGIGKKYIDSLTSNKNKFKGSETDTTYENRQGYKLALPIYYRNKLYTEEEKEKLWIKILDEDIRYINGEKVKASNEEVVFKTLEYYRKINNRLGYGNNEKNWDRKRYERERRNLLFKERVKLQEEKKIVIPNEENKDYSIKGISPNEAF